MKLRQGEIIALVPELTVSSGFEYSLTSATEKKAFAIAGTGILFYWCWGRLRDGNSPGEFVEFIIQEA